MRDVGGALGSMLGGGYVNYFSLGRPVLQGDPPGRCSRDRLNAEQLGNYYITTPSGSSVPVSTDRPAQDDQVVPESLNHFQQLNSATISGGADAGGHPGPGPGNAQEPGQRNVLPQGYSVDYAGQSRQYVQESSALDRHVLLCADHHLSRAGGAVRKLPRPLHRAGQRAHVHLRGHDLHQPGRRAGRASTSTPRWAS